MNNSDAKIYCLNALLEYFYDVRIGLFDSICEFQCILNVEQFNTLHCIFILTDCSVREHQSDFSPLY